MEILGIDKEIAYRKTIELLSMYRELRWFTTVRAKEEVEELVECGNGDLENTLIVLEIFASGGKRRKYKDNINSLFYTKRLINIIDASIMKLKNFPRDGNKYFEIVKDNYLGSSVLSQEAIIEKHHYERSEYFQKRKEAILLIAIDLWK